MLKYAICLVVLVIPLQSTAQERVVTPTGSVPIRFSPPSHWLLGLPGWKIAETAESESYQLLRTLEIHAFSTTHTWAKVELLEQSEGGPKTGWVYWGESLDDDRNFRIRVDSEKNTPEQNGSEDGARGSG